MATRITSCPKCNSRDITELNPEVKETSKLPICKIECQCNECEEKFIISSATKHGRNRGILY